MVKKINWGWIITLVLALPAFCFAQGFEGLEESVTEHTLSNGLKLIIMEKHEAPVISFCTYANVGAVNESKGITGISHLFEHMAFKGTKTIGSKNLVRCQNHVLTQNDKAVRSGI